MEFISTYNNNRYAKEYNCNIKKLICNTNYNYRAHNQNVVDNQFADVKGSYMIPVEIPIKYPTPYMTGKCVSDKERKQIPFNIHTKPRLFSDIIRN